MDDLFDLIERAQADHFWYHGFRSFVAPVLQSLFGARRDLRIVDCGCGTGHNFALVRPYGHAVGFDLSPHALSHARARGALVVRADGTRTPFADASFDAATAFDVLQCTPDDRTSVAEMARIVKPGGVVVMTMAALEFLRGDHSEAWREYRRYTPASARALVEGAGLHVERLQFLFGSLVPLMLTVRLAQRLLRRVRGMRQDSDITVPAAPINAALTMLVRGEAVLSRRLQAPVGSSILVVARVRT